MASFTKVKLISHHIAIVVTAFSVPLVEATPIVIRALAVVFTAASVEIMRRGFGNFKGWIQMFAAAIRLT